MCDGHGRPAEATPVYTYIFPEDFELAIMGNNATPVPYVRERALAGGEVAWPP